MNPRYNTTEALEIHKEAASEIEKILLGIKFEIPSETILALDELRKSCYEKMTALGATNELLNDRYLLDSFINFFDKYLSYWASLLDHNFSNSWDKLQNCLDEFRFIRRKLDIRLPFFEHQLLGIELCYPYTLFASIGIEYSHAECSICAKDIDSDDCIHRRGDLYNGEMAYGIIREITEFDHVALVTNPKDKRCVMQLADSPENFKILTEVTAIIKGKRLPILHLSNVEQQRRTKNNPDYVNLGRNNLCFCGSKVKFKRCCIEKKTIEYDHLMLGISPQPPSLLNEEYELTSRKIPHHEVQLLN